MESQESQRNCDLRDSCLKESQKDERRKLVQRLFWWLKYKVSLVGISTIRNKQMVKPLIEEKKYSFFLFRNTTPHNY